MKTGNFCFYILRAGCEQAWSRLAQVYPAHGSKKVPRTKHAILFYNMKTLDIERFKNNNKSVCVKCQCHTTLYIYMLVGLKIWLLSSRFKNNILLAALVRKILFSPLKYKSRIFAPSCNMLYSVRKLKEFSHSAKLETSIPGIVMNNHIGESRFTS